MDPIWAVTWAAIYHQVVKGIPYYHPSIPPGNDNIRLLRLIPNKNETAIIKCELLNYSLEPSKGTHPYEALSYVWGNPNDTVPIFTDSHVLSVSTNLYAALSRLRDRDFARTLWVDAICIDQANQEEKEHQIQSMAKIYGHASRVVVWLGEAADDSDLALEAIRLAGAKKSTNSVDSERTQQAVLALLRRPWFRRIWILQEVAAARNVLIMCGSGKIDGYAFCLGINSLKYFYKAYPDLRGLIRSVTYLIREAIFRPDYLAGSSGRSSLDICTLGELMDMYHAHEATKRHDKVYALLGMSSNDLSKSGLLPDYKVPWEELLQRLAKFLLSKKISVEAWRDREIAVIKSKGCILGKVTSVQSNMAQDDRQSIRVTFTTLSRLLGDKGEWSKLSFLGRGDEWSTRWTLQVSAEPIQAGDVICLLQGASKPTIIRLSRDHFAIIMITATPSEDVQAQYGRTEWPTLLASVECFNRDFLLVWDWESSSELYAGEYDIPIRTSSWVSERPKTELGSHLDKATRIWNVALILGDLKEHRKATEKLQEAVSGYQIAVGEVSSNTLGTQYDGQTPPLLWAAKNGYYRLVNLLLAKDEMDADVKDFRNQTPLSWAAELGHEAVVKLLLETGKVYVDSKDHSGMTPLSWAAKNGHEGVVKLLLETGKVYVYSKDLRGMTPLWWAAKNGHKGVVKLMESRRQIRDVLGRYPM